MLEEPSDEQREIILSSGGISVSACPGSGKTWTAARLFVNRVKNKSNRLRGIALLSHTNVAVETFKKQIFETDNSIDTERINYIGTIDSFIEKYLITPFYYLFQELDKRPYNLEFERNEIKLPSHISGYKYPICVNDIKCFLGNDGLIYRAKVNNYHNNFIDLPLENTKKLLIKAINKYTRYTHDMRWFIAYEIIKCKNVLRCLANRFSELIIDEAQDTSEIAYDFFDKLKEASTEHLHISLIGDINQSIYSFSGATPSVYEKFIKKWRLNKYFLTINRRSSSQIIRGIDSLFHINMKATSSDNNSGIYYIAKSRYEELGAKKILEFFKLSTSSVRVLSRHNTPGENKVSLYIQKLFAACYKRDYDNNPRSAYKEIIDFIKIYGNFSSFSHDEVNPYVWKMVKNKSSFPSLEKTWEEWRQPIKKSLIELSQSLEISDLKLKCLIKPKKLPSNQLISDFLKSETELQTVHSVKGETCDVVIFIDDRFQWKNLVEYEQENSILTDEELRIAYVAMTRARKFVLLVIPDKHLRTHKYKWESKIRNVPIDTFCYDFKLQ